MYNKRIVSEYLQYQKDKSYMICDIIKLILDNDIQCLDELIDFCKDMEMNNFKTWLLTYYYFAINDYDLINAFESCGKVV